ncbi:ATP-binding protein [Nonomuraea rhodomycinica]|uniref:Tetratricopeptide repeat protein n=1 Tax=Nonomuraea rhodomycinica TaxID=1712872 RepID=A0A7Y6IT07_9ACTN|nr:LuxR C-terminal-related transcriptional regulator [Nonomuraea rhodomycinica]NUW43812.1 tetratricopeptide repeat protein [Nonomuraea rhodomycinica]
MTSRGTDSWSAAGLPAELTSFVGRRHDIAEVKRLLAGSRLVTLVGVGGVGKSRLALRVAAEVQRAFPDGVYLIELAALESPGVLAQALIESLRIMDHSSREPMEVLTDHLRERQTLMVLDNCEHLRRDCAVLAATLVRAAPGLRILATSRQALGAAGEQTMVVPALPVPRTNGTRPGGEPAERFDAMRLFAERAQAVVPDFEITDDNRETVARICRGLDGIPLAIELAAVRLRVISADQLLARLEDRFGLLTTGSRARLPRQQTLRALIDYSHALCTEQEQLLWARLSVFSGSVDLEAAEHVCSGDGIAPEDIVDVITGLVDKSILVREEHGPMVRFRLMETIRQYGRDRLRESGEEAELRRRHRAWYVDLATRMHHEWFGPAQVTWYQRMRLEHDNLRSALDHCLCTPGEAQQGMVLAAALRFYWIAADAPREARRWLDDLLAADPAPVPARLWALGVDARIAVLQSDFAVAAALLKEYRELARTLGDDTAEGGAAYVEGLAALLQSDLPEAERLLDAALACGRGAGDDMLVANALIYLGTTRSLLGRPAEAVGSFEECLSLCETREERWFRSYTLWTYGIEAWKQGDTRRAVEMERAAIRLKEPFKDPLGIALCAEALAWMAAGEGDGRRAATLLGGLEEIRRGFGGPLFGSLSIYHEACEEAARAAVGDRSFETAFRKGKAMSSAEVVAYALRDAGRGDERRGESSPLTQREMEIARLVARGMSNKAIAASLVIAQRTAEGHVENILSKLGFSSRVQIASWVGRQERPADEQGGAP